MLLKDGIFDYIDDILHWIFVRILINLSLFPKGSTTTHGPFFDDEKSISKSDLATAYNNKKTHKHELKVIN